MMRQLTAILWLVGAGGGIAVAEDVPLPRPRPPVWAPPAWVQPTWSEPNSFRAAAGPDFNSAAVTAKPTDCDERLGKIAAIEPMPRLIGPGACGGDDMVRLDNVLLADAKRIEIKPAPYLRCPMAEQLAIWVRDAAVPKVAAAGLALRMVETYDDFDCRGRNRQLSGKVSEHGKGDAVDVRGFTLADGRLMLLTDPAAPKDLRDGLRGSACARFTTVLGPGSDGYHEQHIHLDFIQRRNGYRICEWDVREPPKPPKPPEAAKPKDKEPAAKVATAPATAKPAAPEPTEAEPADDEAAATPATFDGGPVPLPTPRPVHTVKVRRGHRNTAGRIHFPFTLWR